MPGASTAIPNQVDVAPAQRGKLADPQTRAGQADDVALQPVEFRVFAAACDHGLDLFRPVTVGTLTLLLADCQPQRLDVLEAIFRSQPLVGLHEGRQLNANCLGSVPLFVKVRGIRIEVLPVTWFQARSPSSLAKTRNLSKTALLRFCVDL